MTSILDILLPVYFNEIWARWEIVGVIRKIGNGQLMVRFYKPRFADTLILRIKKHNEVIDYKKIDISKLEEGWHTIYVPCDLELTSFDITTFSPLYRGTSISFGTLGGRIETLVFSDEVNACIYASGYEQECVRTRALAISSREPLEVTITLDKPVDIMHGSTVSPIIHEIEMSIRRGTQELSYSTNPIHIVRKIYVLRVWYIWPLRITRLSLWP